ncbi:MAG TPA: serine/threonine-protein kinase [Candidatus Brocadiia bacterium]|nr:serine/threonine-protein kinase [Candidatus Brocadiia bacterium]
MPVKVDLQQLKEALEKGWITLEQVNVLRKERQTRAQSNPDVTALDIAVEMGFLTAEQAGELSKGGSKEDRKAPAQIGGFEILEKLGRGGMGAVFKARQISMGRIVALKILPPKLTKNPSFLERFRREAHAAARINHPNIVQGIDSGVENGFYYFAMEFVDGISLSELIEEKGQIEEELALRITKDVASGLEGALDAGIVHRDIKPSNILLTRKMMAKLSDMGLAKIQNYDQSYVTQAGFAVGTPHYISPEQAMGRRQVDTRSDIYSLGVSLYHMLVGDVPFPDDSPLVVMSKHLNEQMPPVKAKNPGVSDGVLRILDKMTQKRPEQRYQTPTELIADIDKYLNKFEGTSTSAAGVLARVQASKEPAKSLDSASQPASPAEDIRSALRSSGGDAPAPASAEPASKPSAIPAAAISRIQKKVAKKAGDAWAKTFQNIVATIEQVVANPEGELDAGSILRLGGMVVVLIIVVIIVIKILSVIF